MKLCAISFKECWPDSSGRWHSSGGFPLQMTAIGSLFDEVVLLVTRSRPKEGGIPLPAHFQVVPLEKPKGADWRRKLSVMSSLPAYWRTMVRHCRKADVVHVPLPGDLPLLGFGAALLLRKRLIARYGSSWFTNSQTTLMNQFTRKCMKACAGGRNVMLATGEGERPPGSRMSWIFSTALSKSELGGIRPNLDRELSELPHIVYIGRLSPEKGVAHLIEAMAVLKNKGIKTLPRVTLAGDGPQRSSLERQTLEMRCNEVVQFAGQLNRAQLSELLLQADFCVQPSLTEGYSKAWLDAMAHGLPVLASEVGAARGVIGADDERGWLTPPGSSSALAGAIQCVAQQKRDWPALRHRCRSFVEARTLEAWGQTIGSICASQWNLRLMEGKLQ